MNYNVIGGVAGEAAKWLGFGAGIATGFGLISNPIGWAVGAAAGVGYVATKIWAAVRGVEMARERERNAAIASLEQSVRNTGRGSTEVRDEGVRETFCRTRLGREGANRRISLGDEKRFHSSPARNQSGQDPDRG